MSLNNTPQPSSSTQQNNKRLQSEKALLRKQRIATLCQSILPPETLSGKTELDQLDLLLANIEDNHVHTSDIDMEHLLVPNFDIASPSDVTFLQEQNPPPTVNISEEKLFLPFIKQQALSIAKLKSLKDNLIVKQVKYNTYLSSKTLPSHTPIHIIKLLERSSNDDESLTLVKLAIKDMDQTRKIHEVSAKILDLESNFISSLTSIAAQANLTTIGLTKSHCQTLLNNFVRETKLKFALTLENQQAKKARSNKSKVSTPTEPPSVESLLARISKLEKTKSRNGLKPSNFSPKKNHSNSKNHKSSSGSKRNNITINNSKQSLTSSSNSNIRGRKNTTPSSRRGNIILHSNTRSFLNPQTGYQTNQIPRLNQSRISIRINKCFPTISNSTFTNLTNIDLSKYNKILGYGLKYIFPPLHDVNNDHIISSMNRFINNINWKYWFYMNPSPYRKSHNPTLRLPPTPFPPDLMSPQLKITNYNLLKGLDKVLSSTISSFFPPQPLLSEIRNLKHTLPTIKFVSSDKNLGLVALSTLDYHKLAINHLSDKLTYRNLGPIDELPPSFISDIVNKCYNDLIQLSKGINLTHQEKKYISTIQSTIPAFHIIPKLHKTPLAGRPIVGAVNWVTTPFSTLLDIKIQHFLSEHTSIVKDTNDLTQRWKRQPFDPKTEWLVSLDVTSLYTNIITEDLTSIVQDLDPILGKMLNIIMKNNYFEYHEQFFHQIEGLAMGTNCAVSVANLYMAVLIDSKLMNLPSIRLYSRYIDDICFIFKGSKQELDDLILFSNSLHNKLQFTYVASKIELDVLDVTFFSTDLHLEFKTFQKPVNKYLYLPYFSNHPPSTIRGFIKGELIRYSRTNSLYPYELAMRSLFYDRLLARGYPKAYLNSIFYDSPTSSSPLNTTSDSSKAFFVLSYIKSPKTKKIRSYINNLNDLILPPPTYSCSSVWSVLPTLSKAILKSKLTSEQSAYLRSMNFNII